MPENLPSISLLTICWNSMRTLKRTVESVLSQTVLPGEYFFVDGGSTDGTLVYLNEMQPMLEKKGIRCRIIPQERIPGAAGITSAWNQGLPLLSGDIIGMINSDDWYDGNALEQIRDAFAEDPDLGAAVLPTRFLNPDGSLRKIFFPHSLKMLSLLMPVPHPGTFFHRKTYQSVGLYNTDYKTTADYDFIWRCKKAGIRWRYLTEPAVNMELGGLANSSRSGARLETYRIARKYCHPLSPLPAIALFLRLLTRR